MFTKQQFTTAANNVKDLYKKRGLERTWDNKDAFSDAGIKVAWDVYYSVEKATANRDFIGMIIGGLRDDTQPPAEQGSGIDPEVKENFWTMNEATKKYGPAGVLKTANWSVLVNDAWLLAGIHAELKFFLASPRRQVNVYDTDRNRFRVFGRELAGLKTFGYQFEPSDWPQLGEVEVPPIKPQLPTFAEYQAGVDKYETAKNYPQLLGP
ncbi:hypothetical protein ACIRQY_24570 [Streptomyces sp. NPDC101490]|uniref:hypothetical protein n=1 Tax=Streptomyces sp. NPDC101490 TaxID=3366143 RepID=UPI0037F8B1C2